MLLTLLFQPLGLLGVFCHVRGLIIVDRIFLLLTHLFVSFCLQNHLLLLLFSEPLLVVLGLVVPLSDLHNLHGFLLCLLDLLPRLESKAVNSMFILSLTPSSRGQGGLIEQWGQSCPQHGGWYLIVKTQAFRTAFIISSDFVISFVSHLLFSLLA